MQEASPGSGRCPPVKSVRIQPSAVCGVACGHSPGQARPGEEGQARGAHSPAVGPGFVSSLTRRGHAASPARLGEKWPRPGRGGNLCRQGPLPRPLPASVPAISPRTETLVPRVSPPVGRPLGGRAGPPSLPPQPQGSREGPDPGVGLAYDGPRAQAPTPHRTAVGGAPRPTGPPAHRSLGQMQGLPLPEPILPFCEMGR